MCRLKSFKALMKLSKTLTVVEADFEEVYWHSYSSNVFFVNSQQQSVSIWQYKVLWLIV